MIVPSTLLAPKGPKVSRLIYGVWRLADDPNGTSPERVVAKIEACLDAGITTFDQADIYGDYTCEALFGAALALKPSLRTRMQIITKCGIMLVSKQRPQHRLKHYNTDATHITQSVENSLKVLHTDHIDILLIHRPDPLMDPDAIAKAFHELKASGKVLHFGVSNFSPSHTELLASRLELPLVTNQIEVSVLNVEPMHDGTIDYCLQKRMAPMAWSPLGGGRLFHPGTEKEHRVAKALAKVGEELEGVSLDQVALAWLLMHPANIVPILGTNAVNRIHKAAQATHLRLSREQWFDVWRASMGREVP